MKRPGICSQPTPSENREILLYRMQLVVLLGGGQRGVAIAPDRVAALRKIKTNPRRGAGQFADNRARPLVGQVKHHIVPLLAQRLNELPLHLQLIPFFLLFRNTTLLSICLIP